MPITIYPEEPCIIPVKYSKNPLEIYGKEYSDIEDILMCFKIKIEEGEDKYFVKYYKDGQGGGLPSGEVLLDESTNTFSLVKTENDFLPVNSRGYGVYIGVKIIGLSKWIWLRVEKDSKIIVEKDGISV